MRQHIISTHLSFLAIFFSFFVSRVECMCYAQNGSEVFNWGPRSIYQPCSNDTSNPLSTICCATNRSNPPGGSIDDGFTADICLPNGMCQNILTEKDGSAIYAYWRDYCTDSEWREGRCLSVCTGDGQHSDDGTAPLTPCGPTYNATKWCCGTNNTECCSSEDPTQEMTIPNVLGAALSSSTASATSSPTASITASPTSSSSSSANSGLSTGAKAGIGVGAAIGGALLIALGVFGAFTWRRKATRAGKENPYELPPSGYVQAPVGYGNGGHQGYYAAHQNDVSEAAGAEISEIGAGEVKNVKYRSDHDATKQAPVELA